MDPIVFQKHLQISPPRLANKSTPGILCIRIRLRGTSPRRFLAVHVNTLGYGKVAQTAISAMSHLAVHFDEGKTLHNATRIAEARNLPKPLIAKVLTTLAQSPFVSGTAGPRGGYALVVPPGEVTFHDVVTLFERVGERPFCPFGPGWCGEHNPCAVHDEIESLHESVCRFLHETHFGVLESPE